MAMDYKKAGVDIEVGYRSDFSTSSTSDITGMAFCSRKCRSLGE